MMDTHDTARNRYAPMDWIYSRPHGKVVADAAREYGSVMAGASSHRVPGILEKLGPFMKTPTENPVLAALRYSVEQVGTIAAPTNDIDLRWEAQCFSDMMAWCRSGRQIFRFDADMTDSLRNIDFGEATVGDVTHPYESYYLVFDGIDQKLPNGAMLDGVLITSRMMPPKGDRVKRTMEVVEELTEAGTPDDDIMRLAHERISTVPVLTVTFAPRGYALWPERKVHGYSYELELTDPGQPLREALLASANDLVARDEVNVQHHPIPELPEWIDLVMNAALYLTRYEGDLRQRWQTEAPADLVRDAEAGRKGPQRELARRGYAATRFVRFGGEAGGVTDESDRNGVRPHWRRGHWRRQWYGEGRSQQKLILIAPVRVGWKTADVDPLSGTRIYDVKAGLA